MSDEERPVVAVDGRDAMRAAMIEVISGARRSLLILSQRLESGLYQDFELVEALKQQLLSQQRLQVRVLVADPRVAINEAGLFITLARRLSSRFTLHEPDERGPVYSEELVLADESSYFLRSLPDNRIATHARHDPVEGRLWARQFEELWQNSAPSMELRQLN